jgi:putative membrane protein
MWLDAALSVAHFIFVLILAGTLAAELFIMRLAPSAPVINLLTRIDRLYGLSAVGLIAAGVSRVTFGLKDTGFYLSSHAFMAKMAVFIVIGVISIWPTMRFMRWARATRSDPNALPGEAEWKTTKRFVTIEVHLLALVVIFAAMMARGIG